LKKEWNTNGWTLAKIQRAYNGLKKETNTKGWTFTIDGLWQGLNHLVVDSTRTPIVQWMDYTWIQS
jgi:hypothetical protein